MTRNYVISRYDVERIERALAGGRSLWKPGPVDRTPRFKQRHENQWTKHSRRELARYQGKQAKPSYRQRQASARAAKNKQRVLA